MTRSLRIAMACLLLAAPGFAEADDAVPGVSTITLSGTASVLSQRRFRGLALSDDQPAAEAEIVATHVSGAYAGVMVASLAPGPALDAGHGEVDLYAGYGHAITPAGLTLDLGLRAYLYPGQTRLDRVEALAALDQQIGPVDLRAGLAFAPSTRGWLPGSTRRASVYGFGEARGDLPGTPLSLHAHWGCTAGALEWVRSACDYRIGVGATQHRWSVDASVVGTTLGHAETEDISRIARTAVVLGVTLQY